jgi:hypothetical protein
MPERRKGNRDSADAGELHCADQRHMDDDSAVFADMTWTAPKFTAVIDYHRRAADEQTLAGEDTDHAPRWLKHTISYTFPLGEDWKKWVEQNGKPMKQLDFAAFIEDRIAELASRPTPRRTSSRTSSSARSPTRSRSCSSPAAWRSASTPRSTRAQNLTNRRGGDPVPARSTTTAAARS